MRVSLSELWSESLSLAVASGSAEECCLSGLGIGGRSCRAPPKIFAKSVAPQFTEEDVLFARALRGKHVLMMGDSTTRHQYLSLAYRVAHGEWPMGAHPNRRPHDRGIYLGAGSS